MISDRSFRRRNSCSARHRRRKCEQVTTAGGRSTTTFVTARRRNRVVDASEQKSGELFTNSTKPYAKRNPRHHTDVRPIRVDGTDVERWMERLKWMEIVDELSKCHPAGSHHGPQAHHHWQRQEQALRARPGILPPVTSFRSCAFRILPSSGPRKKVRPLQVQSKLLSPPPFIPDHTGVDCARILHFSLGPRIEHGVPTPEYPLAPRLSTLEWPDFRRFPSSYPTCSHVHFPVQPHDRNLHLAPLHALPPRSAAFILHRSSLSWPPEITSASRDRLHDVCEKDPPPCERNHYSSLCIESPARLSRYK